MTTFHELPLEERLALVRLGTSHYSRQLSLIDNADFDEPTNLAGWTRSHVIAHVAYNAIAICNLIHWANTGEETPMYSSPGARNEEIAYGATLIPDALRNLHEHSVARLDVAWRDSSAESWSHEVLTAQGRTVPASETLWMRSREVWIHAVDLGAVASFGNIPTVILETLAAEITQKWAGQGVGEGLVLVDESSRTRYAAAPAAAGESETVISGSLAGIVRYAAGRGVEGVTVESGEVPEPPRWL
ncbi:maleylpyruvate isomerase family mycothiol-dependent enzyme [Corynebacterium callunae]|uniref:Mycothiol-dependent maleylpyruvate isomerase n=1 Tax=Corynebacterium callunae DSM 20147 TaxID=1121353 RepID=M1V0T3_9CORY|nr:maleylpyruvate isomerase family mycothiol-dependent enzyme [Corynebacterium callunae]AGG67953.1 mycothiol-dependent maleylpyruvate isomerase [Corynebacterium callunae DSM 20147]